MLLLFISLVAVFFSITAVLLILSYSLYNWESQKINELTKNINEIEETKTNDYKKYFIHNLFPFKLKDSAINERYSRSLTLLKNNVKSSWVDEVVEMIKKLKTDTWETIKKFFKYVEKITSPSQDLDVKSLRKNQYTKEQEENIKLDIEETIDKMSQTNNSEELAKNFLQEDIERNAEIIQSKPLISISPEDREKFNYLEEKILTKLRSSGIENYDIWLELGKLYLEFKEIEKAREVFSLVLRQSSGKLKIDARNLLYRIS